MFSDILRETPVYQEVFEEGLEKGLEKGLEQGREEGHQEVFRQAVQRWRQVLLYVIIERFPKIVPSIRKQVEAIDDPTLLSCLIVKMSTIQTAKEAKKLIQNVSED